MGAGHWQASVAERSNRGIAHQGGTNDLGIAGSWSGIRKRVPRRQASVDFAARTKMMVNGK